MALSRGQVLALGAVAVGGLSLGGIAAASPSAAPEGRSASAVASEARPAASASASASASAQSETTARAAGPPLGLELGALAGYDDGDLVLRGTVAYRWPTSVPAEVVREFTAPEVPWGPGHRGVDLALGVGEPVLAAADAVVAFAGTVVDRPVVSLVHDDGLRTTYEPVRAVVRAGQQVRAGDVIGHLAAGHCPPWQPSCLHWGARSGASAYVDPLSLVGAEVVVRLLPAR